MMPPSALILFTATLLASAAHAYRLKVDFHDGEIRDLDIPAGNLTADDLLANPRRAVVFSEESHHDKRHPSAVLGALDPAVVSE